jgi:hypothetical protein
MRPRVLYTVLFSLLCLTQASGADSLAVLREIPMTARLMTVDELGNVYVVRENNALVRFNEYGDSSAFYRSVQNGNIGAVDASNPLRVVVYYPAYSRTVLLDRMLAEKNDLNLRRTNVFTTPVIASSADGNLWIYDQFNVRLKKIDEQLAEIAQSNDIRQEAQIVPAPSFMVERNWKVFLCDTANGIFTFDRYGNYINTLSIYGVKYLQVFGPQLLFRHQDTMFSWNMNKASYHSLIIPYGQDRIINAAIVRSTLYVLYADRLTLYRLPKDKIPETGE